MCYFFGCPPWASACRPPHTPPRSLVVGVNKRNATCSKNRLGWATQSGRDTGTPPRTTANAPESRRALSEGSALPPPEGRARDAEGWGAPGAAALLRAAAGLPSLPAPPRRLRGGKTAGSYLLSLSEPLRRAEPVAPAAAGCRCRHRCRPRRGRPMAARPPPLTGAPLRRAPASAPAPASTAPQSRPSPSSCGGRFLLSGRLEPSAVSGIPRTCALFGTPTLRCPNRRDPQLRLHPSSELEFVLISELDQSLNPVPG